MTGWYLQVAPFFFQLEDEAGGLKQAPSNCAVKLGNRAAGVHGAESGLVTEVVAPNDLKAPASIEEIKVLSSSHAGNIYAGAATRPSRQCCACWCACACYGVDWF